MKKLVLILLTVIVIFAFTGCPDVDNGKNNDNSGDNKNTTVPAKKFWALNFQTKTYYQVTAEKLAENSRCEVWVDKESGVTAATANKVASAYYSSIYPKMMNTFGYTVNDKDLGTVNTMQIAHWIATGKTSGAKLTILLLDIQDGYTSEDDPYVAGYFTSLNLYENDPDYPEYKSNELDMIYVDTYPSDPCSDDSNATLAHEMQHLMNFVSTLLMRDDLMDTWIDEGLSTAAEWVYSGVHPVLRWEWYNKDLSGLIKKGNNFYVWGNHDDNPLANLDDYATAYLFFQWLRLQSKNPDNNIYFDILTSEYDDYRAVTTADDINSSHKNNWALLLRDWHAANYTNAASGLYGYKNETDLRTIKAPMFPGGTTTVNLYPGEGVYSRTTTAGSVPEASGNIKYAGLSSAGTAPSDTNSYANGAWLTYNIDTNIEGSSAPGDTTGIAPSISITTGSASVQMLSNKFSGPFKVDANYFIRKNGNKGINKGVSDINIRGVNNKNNNVLKFDRSTIERVFINE